MSTIANTTQPAMSPVTEKLGPNVEKRERMDDELSAGNHSIHNSPNNDMKKPLPDDGANYLKGWSMAVLCIGLCVTTFLVGLDMMIIATAIPKISTLFQSSGDIGW
jgi:hypothetical protein